jgi:hypothetical protein
VSNARAPSTSLDSTSAEVRQRPQHILRIAEPIGRRIARVLKGPHGLGFLRCARKHQAVSFQLQLLCRDGSIVGTEVQKSLPC